MSNRPDDATSFLYPFIDADEKDVQHLLLDLSSSARAKATESRLVRTSCLRSCSASLSSAASQMADLFQAGGRLFVFGNGGSATDAEGAASLFREPPYGRPLPAATFVEDWAVLTALANDVGIEVAFSRQLSARASSGDIVMGFSTSGGSANVLRAFGEAARSGMCTVGLAGYGGGAMAVSSDVRHCLVVDSQSVHRIQEAHNALVMALWTQIQGHMGGIAASPREGACRDRRGEG